MKKESKITKRMVAHVLQDLIMTHVPAAGLKATVYNSGWVDVDFDRVELGAVDCGVYVKFSGLTIVDGNIVEAEGVNDEVDTL